MKKTVYTLSVNDYAPEIIALTFPLMKRWAKKIGADFFVIEDRKFPDFPIPYEKFQISKLSKEHKNDWNIFWDADALIHPDMWDPTVIVGKDVTVSNGSDFVPTRFKPDKYFMRDGRFIGKGNWCMMGSDWVAEDLWRPLDDITPEEVAEQITPIVSESTTVIEPSHLIDDYTVSRNISRYGLKHVLIPTLTEQLKIQSSYPSYLWHAYTIDIKKKTFLMKKQIMLWVVDGLMHGETLVAGMPTDNPVAIAKDILLKLDYGKDNDLDWEEFLAVIPAGQRIADIIKSWGIKFELKSHDKLGWIMKQRMMTGAASGIQDCPQKMQALRAIQAWKGDPDWRDLLGALEIGVNIGAIVKERFGVTVKVKPKAQTQAMEATKHAPLG